MGKRSRRGPVPTGIPAPILGKIPIPPPSHLWKLILVPVPVVRSFSRKFLQVRNSEIIIRISQYLVYCWTVLFVLVIVYVHLTPAISLVDHVSLSYNSILLVLVLSLPLIFKIFSPHSHPCLLILENFSSRSRPWLQILGNFPSRTRPCFLILENFPYPSRIIVKISMNAHVHIYCSIEGYFLILKLFWNYYSTE